MFATQKMMKQTMYDSRRPLLSDMPAMIDGAMACAICIGVSLVFLFRGFSSRLENYEHIMYVVSERLMRDGVTCRSAARTFRAG